MLWTFLKGLLFKPSCEICSLPLNHLKVFCAACQSHCYYQLVEFSDWSTLDQNQWVVDLKKMRYFNKLKVLIENPRHAFLLEGFISLLMLSHLNLKGVSAHSIYCTPIFSKKELNKKFYQVLERKWAIQTVKNSSEHKPGQLVFLIKSI